MFEQELELLSKDETIWSSFVSKIQQEDSVGVVYHSDADGLVGAVYSSLAIEQQKEVDFHYYWISNSEFDFIDLISFVEEKKIKQLIILDISIENYDLTIETLVNKVENIFIFDHHLITNEKAFEYQAPIFFINPTPYELEVHKRPIPTFIFALFLSKKYKIPFPDWLLIISIFSEGFDSYFVKELEKLFENMSVMRNKDMRKTYFNSDISNIGTLIKAEFYNGRKDNIVLEELKKCIYDYNEDYIKLTNSLDDKLKNIIEGARSIISNHIILWESIIKLKLSSSRLIFLPVINDYIIEGPVASILRGKFPQHIFVSYKIYNNKVVYEFRTSEELSINLVEELTKINSSHNLLLNYGGHPTGCGCSISIKDLDKFNKILAEVLNEL